MIVLFVYASVHHFAISLVHLRFHSVYHVVQIHCRCVSVCYSDIEICRYEHFVRLIFCTQLKFNNQSFRHLFSPCTNKNNWVGVCVCGRERQTRRRLFLQIAISIYIYILFIILIEWD